MLQATFSQRLRRNREEKFNGFKRIKETSRFPELKTAGNPFMSSLKIPSRISIGFGINREQGYEKKKREKDDEDEG